MSLDTAEHRRVKRETRATRNRMARNRRAALARAWAWIEAVDARVVAEATPTGLLYTISVPGFHPATARLLPHAVDALQANIETFCNSPAVKGPTGAKLDRLRAALERAGGV